MINRIIFAGCGAVGSLVASFLNLPETIEYILIDDDVVEQQNLGTSIYEDVHVGLAKVDALGHLLYRRNRRVCRTKRVMIVGKMNIDITPSSLIIDTFDNPRARNHTVVKNVPTVHIGVTQNQTGSVMWDDVFEELPVEFERGNNVVCTNQLGSPIIRLVAAYGANSIEEFVMTGNKNSRGVVL